MHLLEQGLLNTLCAGGSATNLADCDPMGGWSNSNQPITVELLRSSTNQRKDILACFTTPPVHM